VWRGSQQVRYVYTLVEQGHFEDLSVSMRKSRKSPADVQVLAPKPADKSPERLEAERESLLRRLGHLDVRAKARPGYRTARTLLNSKFRKSTLSSRVAVLQAAAFMIEILEKLPL
jgi:hypothetical protein